MVDGNRIEGAWDKAKGAIKEGIGELTGNEKLKDEGLAGFAPYKSGRGVASVGSVARLHNVGSEASARALRKERLWQNQ